MLTLGLDTTAGTATAAVVQDGKLLGEYTINSGNTHSTTLLPMIESMPGILYRSTYRRSYCKGASTTL